MNKQDFQSLVERLRGMISTPYSSSREEHPADQLMGTDELDAASDMGSDTPDMRHPAQGKLVGELEERYREFLSRAEVSEQLPQPPVSAAQTTKTPAEQQAERQATQAATKLAQTTGTKPQDLTAAMAATAQGQVPTGAAAQALAKVGGDLSKAISDPQLSQQLLKTVQAAKVK
jgi:hypothetical protein